MKKYQNGATMWSTLSIILMLGFIAYFTAIVGSIYLDYKFIKEAMQTVVDEPKFKTMTKKSLLTVINKRLVINNIRGLSADVITIKRDKQDSKYIHLLYTDKGHIISNVSVLVVFDEEIRTTK